MLIAPVCGIGVKAVHADLEFSREEPEIGADPRAEAFRRKRETLRDILPTGSLYPLGIFRIQPFIREISNFAREELPLGHRADVAVTRAIPSPHLIHRAGFDIHDRAFVCARNPDRDVFLTAVTAEISFEKRNALIRVLGIRDRGLPVKRDRAFARFPKRHINLSRTADELMELEGEWIPTFRRSD